MVNSIYKSTCKFSWQFGNFYKLNVTEVIFGYAPFTSNSLGNEFKGYLKSKINFKWKCQNF